MKKEIIVLFIIAFIPVFGIFIGYLVSANYQEETVVDNGDVVVLTYGGEETAPPTIGSTGTLGSGYGNAGNDTLGSGYGYAGNGTENGGTSGSFVGTGTGSVGGSIGTGYADGTNSAAGTGNTSYGYTVGNNTAPAGTIFENGGASGQDAGTQYQNASPYVDDGVLTEDEFAYYLALISANSASISGSTTDEGILYHQGSFMSYCYNRMKGVWNTQLSPGQSDVVIALGKEMFDGVPQSVLTEFQNYTDEDVSSIRMNSDGGVTMTVSRSAYEEMVQGMRGTITELFQSLTASGGAVSMVAFSDDYSQVRIMTGNAELTDEEAMYAYWTCAEASLFHVYSGQNFDSFKIQVVNSNTNNVVAEMDGKDL